MEGKATTSIKGDEKSRRRREIDQVEAMRRFGDEHSSLLDNFERLAFEVHLSRAMRLGRSLSESGSAGARLPAPETEPRRRPRRRGISAAVVKGVVKRLLRPIVGGKKEAVVAVSDPKDPRFWKTFSRSLRF